MSNCDHKCSTCKTTCSEIDKYKVLKDTKITKIIAVLSGKGGVGKSMISSLLAIELKNKGYQVGIMDADITGPSIAKMFAVEKELFGDKEGIFPAVSKSGIKIVSINMMLETPETPVIWKGPILSSVINQFYSEVHWGELDYLIVDMPPGTSDIALSVMQTLPVNNIVMVTTPSKLVSMVVAKAINMANKTNVNVAGLVVNMSYVNCEQCNHQVKLYKEDDSENIAFKYNLDILAKLPLLSDLADDSDNGEIEKYNQNYLAKVIERIEND